MDTNPIVTSSTLNFVFKKYVEWICSKSILMWQFCMFSLPSMLRVRPHHPSLSLSLFFFFACVYPSFHVFLFFTTIFLLPLTFLPHRHLYWDRLKAEAFCKNVIEVIYILIRDLVISINFSSKGKFFLILMKLIYWSWFQ